MKTELADGVRTGLTPVRGAERSILMSLPSYCMPNCLRFSSHEIVAS